MPFPMSLQLIAESIDDYNASTEEKKACYEKARLTILEKLENGELKEGEQLRIRKEEHSIVLMDKDNTIVFAHRFTESNILVKADIMEQIIKNESLFQKDIKSNPKFKDIGFYKHAHFCSWCNFNATEFIAQIKTFEEQSGQKLTLKDCDVKTCKVKGRKYKRITFTNKEHIRNLSQVEFVFGTLIDGWTYIILPEKWTQIKGDVIPLVDYQETTYGSKTRWDMGGNEYKAKH